MAQQIVFFRLRRIKETHRHRLLGASNVQYLQCNHFLCAAAQEEEEDEDAGAAKEGTNEKLSFQNRLRACGVWTLFVSV